AADDSLAIAHYNLGTVLGLAGDYADAAIAFERSLELGRSGKDTLLNLGELYQFLERYSDAAHAYQRAIELDPGDAEPAALLGELWYSLGEVKKARDAYDAALDIEPTLAVAVAGRALLCELWGDIDAGLALLDHAGGGGVLANYARARLLRRKGKSGAALKLLRDLSAEEDHVLARDPRLYFTLGEVQDELGDYDAAFASVKTANELKPAPFDPLVHQELVQAQVEFFSPETWQQLTSATADSRQPLFIVGMPRSGTSLVEQILASHDEVHAGGERFEIIDILRQLGPGYPQSLTRYTADDLNQLAQSYMNSYGDCGGAQLWTDKLPKNFLHLGLIALLFPHARVVYCRRDVRDTGLSVYFQNMNFRSDPWASRLEHIAAYTESCERIMTHWQSVLPLPMLEVEYESVIAAPEPEIRRLLTFLDLPWEPRCLAFHRTKRLVNTASYAQVRQPIYQTSAGRWKNYAKFLGPLGR
ncbi:MAG: sulfotransferase, partial [Gammaproteobacteria bacterium]|nr:sulfotransferase [Gammaproteobacteria bacterium]